jgi:hypothetical protein
MGITSRTDENIGKIKANGIQNSYALTQGKRSENIFSKCVPFE